MISLTQKLNKLNKMEGNVVMAEEVQVCSFEIELIEVTKILIKCIEDHKVFNRYICNITRISIFRIIIYRF